MMPHNFLQNFGFRRSSFGVLSLATIMAISPEDDLRSPRPQIMDSIGRGGDGQGVMVPIFDPAQQQQQDKKQEQQPEITQDPSRLEKWYFMGRSLQKDLSFVSDENLSIVRNLVCVSFRIVQRRVLSLNRKISPMNRGTYKQDYLYLARTFSTRGFVLDTSYASC